MSKILVILTGGTIGSRIEGNVIDVSGTSPRRLLAMYREKYGDSEEFEVIQPLNLLSENMTPEMLLILLKALDRVEYGNYAGVILAHGSDTLSYTASFVGLLFHHVPVPVVLVASNYPLGEKGSNGLANFAGAVDLIRHSPLRGVFVLYQDDCGRKQVYLATRFVEAEPFGDQFRDFSGTPLGRVEEGRLVLNQAKSLPGMEELQKARGIRLPVPNSFSRKILVIRPYPGLDYAFFRFDSKRHPAAVLHLLYHSATACLGEGNYDLLHFLSHCRELGVPVYTGSHKALDGKRYATGDILLGEGVIPLLNISPEAAYAKLLILYNTQGVSVPEMIGKDLYFESVDPAGE